VRSINSSRARKRETAPERSDGDPNGVSGNAANNPDGCGALIQAERVSARQRQIEVNFGILYINNA